ncbi:hypothetical protein EBR43_00335 [bacterium]|nr:hypothetical protein [bacterium]NBX72325.1 hypothetical protein [bacterium]
MHSRILVAHDEIQVYHSATLAALLTTSIKKNCIDLFETMGFHSKIISFFEREVEQTPIQLEARYVKEKENRQLEELVGLPLAQFLIKQLGYQLKKQ